MYYWECDMVVANQHTWAMFFFHTIEKMIMYENDCYYFTKDTKRFLLILINYYVEILLIWVCIKIYDHSKYPQIVIKKILLFFSSSIRMSGKDVNFGYKKIKKMTFTKTKK